MRPAVNRRVVGSSPGPALPYHENPPANLGPSESAPGTTSGAVFGLVKLSIAGRSRCSDRIAARARRHRQDKLRYHGAKLLEPRGNRHEAGGVRALKGHREVSAGLPHRTQVAVHGSEPVDEPLHHLPRVGFGELVQELVPCALTVPFLVKMRTTNSFSSSPSVSAVNNSLKGSKDTSSDSCSSIIASITRRFLSEIGAVLVGFNG